MQVEAFTIQILLIVGLIIVVGFASGKIFQRLKIPRVLGFIILGLVFGSIGVIPPSVMESLRPIIDLALGFIGFSIGNELDLKKLLKGSKKLFIILIMPINTSFNFLMFKVWICIKNIGMNLEKIGSKRIVLHAFSLMENLLYEIHEIQV